MRRPASILKGCGMTTLADLIDARAGLMAHWEKALKIAAATGYWTDVHACARVIEEFHNYVCNVLNSGAFSGDASAALVARDKCGIAENEYSRIAEVEARQTAPKIDGNAWWEVFGVAPNSSDEYIRAAYTEKLKQCHPDRVSGLAPQLVQLADDMAKKLNLAFEASKRRPAWWTE